MVVCVLSLPDTRQLDPVPQVSRPHQVMIPEFNVEIYVRGFDRIAGMAISFLPYRPKKNTISLVF